jgi:hypothetical protein
VVVSWSVIDALHEEMTGLLTAADRFGQIMDTGEGTAMTRVVPRAGGVTDSRHLTLRDVER